ncbi:MAG: L-glutamate gamma-semialdehyde dehydrogenase [Bryobacterales bacterium]|nr:L-glutamate gamma-semialdehyde dehydrogenase [Bryobacterales bacterium]
MSTQLRPDVGPLSAFRNEPYADFSVASNRAAMEEALGRVRNQFGQEYDLMLGGRRRRLEEKLHSRNPSRSSETVGVHQMAGAAEAAQAVEDAADFFAEWSRTPPEERCRALLRTADLIRRRKMEFDAWLVYEAGKTWIEAEADVSEAIDFCEYYAREMLRLAGPHPMLSLPGEQDELEYIPLGVGVVIAPWNFPLAILLGMTTATLVTGNTAVIKPSSDTPTIAARLAEVLLEAGFPPRSFSLITGSGGRVGDALVEHPKTRFIAFTGSRDVGLRINELAARPRPGQIWIKRVIAEMGGKDAIIVDREADLDQAVTGVLISAYGYQGQKCSACSRTIVDQEVYDEFLARLIPKVEALRVGPSDDPGNYMGPIINEKALRTIRDYIEIGKKEGRIVAGEGPAPDGGHFIRPVILADVGPRARVFQEEIFGPVLAVTKARDFQHALELANDTEYGLTGAVYTTNAAKIAQARREFFVGNLYFNRKCTGAMVGAHPFGGFNMSGTDSKAGGPDYLLQFVQAKSIAVKL